MEQLGQDAMCLCPPFPAVRWTSHLVGPSAVLRPVAPKCTAICRERGEAQAQASMHARKQASERSSKRTSEQASKQTGERASKKRATSKETMISRWSHELRGQVHDDPRWSHGDSPSCLSNIGPVWTCDFLRTSRDPRGSPPNSFGLPSSHEVALRFP